MNQFNAGLKYLASIPGSMLWRNRSGRWVYIGREVPAHLAFVRPDGTRPSPREAAIACRCGMRMSGLVQRTWATREEAEQAARTEETIEPSEESDWNDSLLKQMAN